MHPFIVLAGLALAMLWALIFSARPGQILGDPDIWWHIRTGRWIWETWSFPVTDSFSHSFFGKPWFAKEWLSQMLFFGAFAAAGWNGVLCLSMASMALAAAVLFFLLARDLAPIPALIVTLLSLLLASTSFVARPHMLSLVLVIIWTYQVFRAAGEDRAPHFGWLLLLVPWANLHAAFTIGFVVAFAAGLDFLERTRLSRPDMIRRWICFLALCPVLILLNPYGWQILLPTLTAVTSNEAIPNIGEWQPFDAGEELLQTFGLLGLLFAALVSGFRLGFARALLIVLLVYLTLNHMRYVFFLYPIAAIVVAPGIARQFPALSSAAWCAQPRDALERAVERARRPLLAGLAAGFLLIAASVLLAMRPAPPEEVAASAAIRFAKSGAVSGHVFNFYNFGGPLIFNDIPTFIDGRTEQLFLDGFAKSFIRGPATAEELQAALRKFDVGWTLLPPRDERIALLDNLAGWKRVYTDEHAVIHARERLPQA